MCDGSQLAGKAAKLPPTTANLTGQCFAHRPDRLLETVLAAYLKPSCRNWYQISLLLNESDVDPFFSTVATLLPDQTLVLGGGSDLVQLALRLPKNLTLPTTEVNQLAISNDDPLSGWLFFRDIPVSAYRARPPLVLPSLDLNPESGHNLAVFVSNHCSGRHLADGDPRLMLPIKHCCLAYVSAQGQAKLYFRTRNDYEDYLAKRLTLPDADRLDASAWLESIHNEEDRADALWYCLHYNLLVYARALPLGWRYNDASLKFLRDLVSLAGGEEIEKAVDHVIAMLSGPESKGHQLNLALMDLGLLNRIINTDQSCLSQ